MSGYYPPMHVLFEFFPLILFLAAYLYKDIYLALAVLMVALPVGLLLKYLKTKKLDRMYLWSTIFLLVAGGLTFLFEDPAFLYWKPTAFYWAAALAFVGSRFIGDKPLVHRFINLAGDLPTEQITLSQWRSLNLVWALFFVSMGILNIYVAFNFPEPFWVKFKVFGIMGLTIVFLFAQALWLFSKMDLSEETDSAEID
ncbi:MAG: inner membrane-spanning protein YciB [Methyloligellaceae bacterium]